MQNRILDPRFFQNEAEKQLFADFIQDQLSKQIYFFREMQPYSFLPKGKNVSQTIRLSCSLIWTACRNPNAYHFEVFTFDVDKRVGSTNHSEILTAYGKLNLEADHCLKFKPSDDVVKYQHHFANKIFPAEMSIQAPLGHFSIPKQEEASLHSIMSDVKFSKKAGIRIKSPIFFQVNQFAMESFTVTERHQGRDLLEIIIDDVTYKKFLSTDLRIKLSIALLRALKAFHKKRIVHRDLKPDNIIVDIDYAKEEIKSIKIFDCEMSKDFDEINKRPCGTRDYIAPEVLASEDADEYADIFSYGKVLGFIWRAIPDNFENWKKVLESFNNAQGGYILKGVFRDIFNLKPEHQRDIQSALEQMMRFDKKERWNVDQVLDPFERIQCERKKNRCTDNMHYYHVLLADQYARMIRYILGNIEQQDKKINIHLVHIFKQIQQAFNPFFEKLIDDPLVIEQFVDRLGIQAFNGMKSKKEIRHRINFLFSSRYDVIQSMIEIVHHINRLTEEEKRKFGKAIESFFYDMNKIQAQFHEAGVFNFDRLVFLNEKLLKMVQKHKTFTALLENLIEQKNIKRNVLNALHLETKTSKTGLFSTSLAKPTTREIIPSTFLQCVSK